MEGFGGGGGRGVTKGFACNTPQVSRRHVNISAKLFNFEMILVHVALRAWPG